jgi:2-haloacid dehalogenase
MPTDIKACIFDVFGTVVDWRTSVSKDLASFAVSKGISGVDWLDFAVAWRKLYQPGMDEVRSGRRAWTILDVLHRESLVRLIGEFGIRGMSEADIDHMNRAWHRLDPWPDAVPGLTRLRTRYIIAPCSNGNIALMVNMAKRAGLPWDCILGAELVRHYKPDREVYQSAADFLGLRVDEVLMVAAHLPDLRAAKGVGLRTAFVPRPLEQGPQGKPDLHPDDSVDLTAPDFNALAAALGA